MVRGVQFGSEAAVVTKLLLQGGATELRSPWVRKLLGCIRLERLLLKLARTAAAEPLLRRWCCNADGVSRAIDDFLPPGTVGGQKGFD
jgi:hypothetical protein